MRVSIILLLERMSQDNYTEEINVSNILTLNFTYIEEKLKKNFEIIAKRLGKLEGLFGVEDKIKGMERQAKFLSMKLENVILKLPQVSMGVGEDTVNTIFEERIKQYMSSPQQDLKSTRFFFEVKDAVVRSLRQESKLTPVTADLPTVNRVKKGGDKEKNPEAPASDPQRSALVDQIDKETVCRGMTKEEAHYADKILKQNKTVEEMVLDASIKLRLFQRDYEKSRISRGSLQTVNNKLEKYDQFQTFDNRSVQDPKLNYKQKTRRAGTSMKHLDNPQNQGLEDKPKLKAERESSVSKTARFQELNVENSKVNINSMIADRDYAQTAEVKMAKKKSLLDQLAPDNFRVRDEREQQVREDKMATQKKEFKRIPRKDSRARLTVTRVAHPEIERRKIEDLKDVIMTIRQLEKAIDEKVNKELFVGIVEDIEEKLEVLRHTRQLTDTSEVKKFCMSMENRMQAVISFVQQFQQDEDPLIAKKKWSCMSCDKQTQKYSAKVGSHLNWEVIGGKKLSPMKAGAFGQTVMLANKVKNSIEGRNTQRQ